MSRSGRVVQPDVTRSFDLYLWGRVAQQAGEPTGRDPTALVIDHGNHVGGQGASSWTGSVRAVTQPLRPNGGATR